MATATRPTIPLPSALPGAGRPTSPLPQPALTAMARLDIRLSGTRAEWGRLAESRYNALLTVDPCKLTDDEFAEYSAAGDLLAEARALPSAAERAVVRFEVCQELHDRLLAQGTDTWTGQQLRLFGDAKREMAERREFLTRAGLAHLVEGGA